MSYISKNEKREILQLLYYRDGPTCSWCDKPLRPLDKIPEIGAGRLPGNYPTVDHLIKQEHGGIHSPINYRLACPKCNSSR